MAWCVLSCTAFSTRSMFFVLETVWACLSVGISVVCCVPIWNITELIHYHHHLPVYSAAWQTFILRNWMAALWFCLDGFAAGYTVFKLCCNECIDIFKYAVLGKCLPVCLQCQMYRCVYHLHCHSIGMDFSFTCLIGLIIWNIFISFLVSLIFFYCRVSYCTVSGYSLGYFS
jgi:hypothetical protein